MPTTEEKEDKNATLMQDRVQAMLLVRIEDIYCTQMMHFVDWESNDSHII